MVTKLVNFRETSVSFFRIASITSPAFALGCAFGEGCPKAHPKGNGLTALLSHFVLKFNKNTAPRWGYTITGKLPVVCGIRGIILSYYVTEASVHDPHFANDPKKFRRK